MEEVGFDRGGIYKVQAVAHHGHVVDDAGFDVLLDEVNDLILGMVAPVAVEDQKEILHILKAGVVDPTTIGRIKKLIEMRGGANFALFFQKLEDPTWLDPLVAEGFFKGAPAPMTIDRLHLSPVCDGIPVSAASGCARRGLHAGGAFRGRRASA